LNDVLVLAAEESSLMDMPASLVAQSPLAVAATGSISNTEQVSSALAIAHLISIP
jgi:hypothetical protein